MSPTQVLGIALVLLAALAVVAVVAKPELLASVTKSVSGFENMSGPMGPAASPDMMVPNSTNKPQNVSGFANPEMPANNGPVMMPGNNNNVESFADSGASDANVGGPASMPFAAGNAPSNCYPKNQLNPKDLLPEDPNSKWAQVNPQGAGDIAGKNYLNAGALIGVNTVGQSLRNASYDLRSEPANPQVAVSPWFNSTIEPDTNRKTFEIA